ncbi:globin [Shewanella sp. NIFS-20-20]|uniref:globin n=1 Tax=Shewanella sp. NIFS-20-20 TaxID=2853806 RepID=UPI001C487A1C|nr:globin [Shewanella sp. NIFS-20-20]MBV7316644.1 globin [Shewanella sp. NIFS-20-20]
MMDYNAIFNASYERITKRYYDEFIEIFYYNLINKCPDIKSRIEALDMQTQRHVFKHSLAYMVYFSSVRISDEELTQLAIRHQKMGIKAEQFPLWLDAFVETLPQVDSRYTANDADAWRIILAPSIEFMRCISKKR